MELTNAYYDFCIPYTENANVMRSMLQYLVHLGYRTVALEQIYDHTKKVAGKRAADIFPEPKLIKNWEDEFKTKLKILQRLTIIYADGAVTHAMTNSSNIRKYNFIAGQPKTDAALTHCCTTFNGDIITFDSEAGAKLMVNRKAYQVAVKRGMFFEIKYGPAIADSNNRKDMIKVAHNYFIKGKSKNIIISSGAQNAFQLRGPYDVANLAFIFGLSTDQGKNAINRFCRQLYLRAQSRRLGKTIMFIKSSGPVVFSDSSTDGEEESDVDMNVEESVVTKLGTKTKIAESSNEENKLSEQPNKRLKIS